MRIDPEVKLDFSDVLIRPKRSNMGSRRDADITRSFEFSTGQKFKGVPIFAANMDTIATFEMARSLRKFDCHVALHKHYTPEELVTFFRAEDVSNVWYSMGIVDADLEKFKIVNSQLIHGIERVCIDVANGYSAKFLDFVARFRDDHPTVTIMAGNVVTGDITEQLILSGVDIVKVGIGPGSVCTTRKMTGVGYPQLSAVIECADAAHGLDGFICSDGGCVDPGDVSKAFAGGADFVMLGGMLAGHDECGGKVVDGKMEFYGMSSKAAQEKHSGGVASYKAAEGKRVLIPYKGPVAGTIEEIQGGVRSTCTYVGARTLKQLSKRTTFILVSNQRNLSLEKYNA